MNEVLNPPPGLEYITVTSETGQDGQLRFLPHPVRGPLYCSLGRKAVEVIGLSGSIDNPKRCKLAGAMGTTCSSRDYRGPSHRRCPLYNTDFLETLQRNPQPACKKPF